MSEPNYRRKHVEVFARQADRTLTVLHNIKGEQTAKKDDWLVGSERGKIEVFKKAAFEAEFEMIHIAPDMPVEPNPIDPDVQGDGDGDASDEGRSEE